LLGRQILMLAQPLSRVTGLLTWRTGYGVRGVLRLRMTGLRLRRNNAGQRQRESRCRDPYRSELHRHFIPRISSPQIHLANPRWTCCQSRISVHILLRLQIVEDFEIRIQFMILVQRLQVAYRRPRFSHQG